MKRFYTVPYFEDYPFVVIPYGKKAKSLLLNRNFEHAILDCGVSIFAKGNDDYPEGFFEDYCNFAQEMTQVYGERLWTVIPDYPDDEILPNSKRHHIPHNVRKTLLNVERYHVVEGVNWVYPLQSSYLNLQSFHDGCHQIMKFNPQRVAIGTVCKTQNIEFIEKCVRMARQHFPFQHIHAFGPTLSSLFAILPYIDSWDSTAWDYRCRMETTRRGQKIPFTNEIRKKYLEDYLAKIKVILDEDKKQIRFLEVKKNE
jgi:hypothetical protein